MRAQKNKRKARQNFRHYFYIRGRKLHYKILSDSLKIIMNSKPDYVENTIMCLNKRKEYRQSYRYWSKFKINPKNKGNQHA